MDNQNQEVLLRVENLCQYFRSGKYENKAVNNVSFDIKKGEVFGLVGESGCGKTTTGRSIIRLYDITSGNIYFKGKRIAAGTRSYKDAIKNARAELKAFAKECKAEGTDEAKAKLQKKTEEVQAFIAEQKKEMASALYDQKHCDKQLITKIQMIFQDPIASLDPRMTVRDIIAEGLVINGMTDKELINQKVYDILETVGLVREHADRYPHEFSGG